MDYDAAGNFVVVWQSGNGDADGDAIIGQRFDATGAKVGGEFTVNTTTSGNQRYPDLTVNDDGTFVVVWNSADASGDGLFAQRFDASATKQGGEIAVNWWDERQPAVRPDRFGRERKLRDRLAGRGFG